MTKKRGFISDFKLELLTICGSAAVIVYRLFKKRKIGQKARKGELNGVIPLKQRPK